MNYVLFNKKIDYERGRLENCRFADGCLRLLDGAERGVFFSRIIDGQEKENSWHRLELCADAPSDACLRIRIYASDELPQVVRNGRRRPLSELLRDKTVSAAELSCLSAPFLVRSGAGPQDLLLHEVRARWLWLEAALFRQSGESPSISGIRIEFPKESWTGYLPRIYQEAQGENSFLERYLAIFESISSELEQRIRSSQRLLDAESGDGKMLPYLAEWLGADTAVVWDRAAVRRLLCETPKLSELRGTKAGLLRLIALCTGREACVVETFEAERFMDSGEGGISRRKALERLYGRERFRFCLLVPEEVIPGAREYEALSALVRDMAPAHMEAAIVPLKNVLILGGYTYLGVNSRLGRCRELRLNGASMLAFTVVGENARELPGGGTPA